jgi:hypothetical protein
VDGFPMLKISNNKEIIRDFFEFLAKTLEFCPFFANPVSGTGINREFPNFSPNHSDHEP